MLEVRACSFASLRTAYGRRFCVGKMDVEGAVPELQLMTLGVGNHVVFTLLEEIVLYGCGIDKEALALKSAAAAPPVLVLEGSFAWCLCALSVLW